MRRRRKMRRVNVPSTRTYNPRSTYPSCSRIVYGRPTAQVTCSIAILHEYGSPRTQNVSLIFSKGALQSIPVSGGRTQLDPSRSTAATRSQIASFEKECCYVFYLPMGVVNHDISRLNVAMHYSVSVNEVQGLEIMESAGCPLF